MKRIACIGDNCIDFYDETGERYPGGNPVNVSVYFRRLGTPSSYIGAVGNDENGKMIIDSLAGKSVDVSHVKVLEGITAVTHVQRISGERVFGDSDPGVSALLELTEEDLIDPPSRAGKNFLLLRTRPVGWHPRPATCPSG